MVHSSENSNLFKKLWESDRTARAGTARPGAAPGARAWGRTRLGACGSRPVCKSYIYIYIYTYIYIYIYIYYLSLYIYIYIYIYDTYIYIYTHIHVTLCVYIYIYIYTFVVSSASVPAFLPHEQGPSALGPEPIRKKGELSKVQYGKTGPAPGRFELSKGMLK